MSIGKVYIVGAGPGSADLLTIRGLRAIKKADILICDSLLPKTFLDDLGVSQKTRRIEWLADGNNRKSQKENWFPR